jgi:hypothetical protein
MTDVTPQASDPLTLLESEITAAGHQLERTFEGAVANAPRRGDPGWSVRVGGQLVATGGSVGRVEEALRGWWRVGRAEASPRQETTL